MEEKVFIKEIKLNETSPYDDDLRPVKISLTNGTFYHFYKIDELMELLKWWIIGEEEKRFPQPRFMGRWLLFEEIKKVFLETPGNSEENLKKYG